MDYSFALNLFIKPTIVYILLNRNYEIRRFMNIELFNNEIINYEMFYDSMISYIRLTQIKDENGWIIDLSDYGEEDII